MGPLCFSSVPILRCDLLSLSQNIAMVIPVVLEALSTTTLFLKFWSRRQLLLTCESWMYLLLAIIELISQLYPPMRQGLNTFRNFDTIIGMMSFIPILLYSSFLCTLVIFEFMDLVSTRLRTVVVPCLFFFIPFLVGMNQAASFIGISYVFSPLQGPMIIFEDSRGRSTWKLFTNMTLGLFTSFQMIVWCFVAFRVAQILLEQRRLDYRPSAGFPKIGGIGWTIIGIKLAAVETMIGFAGSGFKIILTRRIMRCVSRALLCMGLLVGPSPLRFRRRKSRLEPEVIKTYVSETRLSAFHRLSPTATAFLEKPGVPYRRWSQPGTLPLTVFRSLSSSDRRATIHFDNGTPKLQLRLSNIDLPDPMALAKCRTSWQSGFLYPHDRPFTIHEYHSLLDLGDVEIVSVPRTTYVPEKAKPTLFRSASGRMVVHPAAGCLTNPFASSQNDGDKRKHLARPIISTTTSSAKELPPLPVPLSDVTQSEENKRETHMLSSPTQDWLTTNLPAPPMAAHVKMYSLDRIRASVSAPELAQADSSCADLLHGVTCVSSWSLDTSESSLVSGALADEGNSEYQSARTSFKRSTLSLYEPLRKSSRSSLQIHREPDQFKKLDTFPLRELLCNSVQGGGPPPSLTPLVDSEAASVPSHVEQLSVINNASSWSFDTETSQSSMVFGAPTDENIPAHQEGGQCNTRFLRVPGEESTQSSLWTPELSMKPEHHQPKLLCKDDVVPALPLSPVGMYSLNTSPGRAKPAQNASSLSLDTATSESSMVFRAPTDESVPAYISTSKGVLRGTGKRTDTQWLYTPWEESNHSRPWWAAHREPHLSRKLELPSPQPEMFCNPVQDGMQSLVVEGLDTASGLSQWESLPARPESEVVDIDRGMEGRSVGGPVPRGRRVPAPALPVVLESPRLATRNIKTDDEWQPKRIIVQVTQSSIDDRL